MDVYFCFRFFHLQIADSGMTLLWDNLACDSPYSTLDHLQYLSNRVRFVLGHFLA